MIRGEVRYAQIGRKRRPVLALTLTAVIDIRERVTVAETTSRMPGLAVEVRFARAGRKRRPVLALTLTAVIDVRERVTVAETTSRMPGLAVEVRSITMPSDWIDHLGSAATGSTRFASPRPPIRSTWRRSATFGDEKDLSVVIG